MNDAGFTHLDESGAAHMVDVGDKDATRRRAVARSVVAMESTTAAAIADGDVKKGDVPKRSWVDYHCNFYSSWRAICNKIRSNKSYVCFWNINGFHKFTIFFISLVRKI